MNAEEKILKAKIQLQKSKPFFAYLLLHMKVQEHTTMAMPTMAVDREGKLYYDPTFVDSLSDTYLQSALCHEIMHTALEHLTRLHERKPKLFNIATDIVVNNLLLTNDMDIPSNWIYPVNNEVQIGKYVVKDIDKKTAEEIYNELHKNLKGKIQNKGTCVIVNDNGREQKVGFDSHEYSKSTDQQQSDKTAKEWHKRIVEAYTYAKQIGREPAGVGRQIKELLEEKINWKTALYKYVTNNLPFDYTYSRPSKRSIASGYYMPNTLREEIEIVVALDTSGSIAQNDLSEFLAEMVGISKAFTNVKMTAIICDAVVHEVYEFCNGNIQTILDMKIRGGGGTSHKPVYKWVEENKPSTKLLINFTDGFTDLNKLQETVQTLWVITEQGCSEKDIPFGEVIRLGV